nr:MFS transporter [Pandoraea sp. LA3]
MAPAAEDFVERTYAKVTWRILPFLLACYLLSYLDRVNVGFVKMQMMADLRFSDTVYGLGAGIFFLAYFFVEIPSNLIMHKVGARVWIARIMISWGVISAGMAFVTTPTSFYVMRFLLGVAEAGFYPGVILYLSYWYPTHRRGKMFAIFALGVPLSGMIGGPISGYLLHTFRDAHPFSAWQWLFVLEGIPSVIAGVAALFWLTDRVEHATWLSESQKRLLAAEVAADARHQAHVSLRAVFRDKRVWLLTLIYFCMVAGFYTVGFWLPSFIATAGITDPLQVGALTAVPYACAVAAMVFISRSADRRRERRWHLALTAAMGIVGLIISAVFGHHLVIAMVGLALAAAGGLTTVPLFWSLPAAFLDGIAAAAGIALINSLGNLAGFFGPYLMGYTKDLTHSTHLGIGLICACMTIGALLIFRLPAAVVNR